MASEQWRHAQRTRAVLEAAAPEILKLLNRGVRATVIARRFGLTDPQLSVWIKRHSRKVYFKRNDK